MLDTLIVQVLAVGLTVSQLFNLPPEKFKMQFHPQTDQAEVVEILKGGCQLFEKEFADEMKEEDVTFDDLFSLFVENAESQVEQAKEIIQSPLPANVAAESVPSVDPNATARKDVLSQLLARLDPGAFRIAYGYFCKSEVGKDLTRLHIPQAIELYNKSLANLPDANAIKDVKLLQASQIYDINGDRFAEVYKDRNRRYDISIAELPKYVPQAFVALEDKTFYKHNGLDIRGIARAFANNMMKKMTGSEGKLVQGGSTITQQVIKNVMLTDDVKVERKIAEMVLARRIETILTKDQILELYLNRIFMGRACWGIECGARAYFGKSAKHLSVAEAALLAGLVQGPNYNHTERQPKRALGRRNEALNAMKAQGYIDAATYNEAIKIDDVAKMVTAYEPPRRKGGYAFIDQINRQVKEITGSESLVDHSFKVHTSLHPPLQKAAEMALQKGLFEFDIRAGKTGWNGATDSLANAIARNDSKWQDEFPKVIPKLYDLHWPLAVVIRAGKSVRVALQDGREADLVRFSKDRPKALQNVIASLKQYDLINVEMREGKKKGTWIAEPRFGTRIQGSAVVLENKTGRVLAMTGGFSHGQTPLNRVTQTRRAVGSTLKPFVYLTALQKGFQPDYGIPNRAISLPPLERGGKYWTPGNYSESKGDGGMVSMRRAVERSINRPTAHMLAPIGDGDPAFGLNIVKSVLQSLGIYGELPRRYPIILGAEPARVLDLAVAYATIANLGWKPTPSFVDSVELNGQRIKERQRFNLQQDPNIDGVSYYQIRRILEGTLSKNRGGTAAGALGEFEGVIAGKTGTSNRARDVWFIGFTNQLTIAVWVGYDNDSLVPKSHPRMTGGAISAPIVGEIFKASFDVYHPMEPLEDPPAEIQNLITERKIGNYTEYFRRTGGKNQSDLISQFENAPYQDDYASGEEEDESQMAWLSPEEEQAPVSEPTNDYLIPGDEDLYQQWQRQGRDNDPLYERPIFFR